MSATTDDLFTVRQHGTWTEMVTHPAWAWSCEKCGWLGLECSSENFARQEASRHVAERHAPHPSTQETE